MIYREVLYKDEDLRKAVAELEELYRDETDVDGWILENAVKLWLTKMVEKQLRSIIWWTVGPYSPMGCRDLWREALRTAAEQQEVAEGSE
jgi:hypothetical protein